MPGGRAHAHTARPRTWTACKLLALAGALAAAALPPAAARASSTQESWLQDDNQLIFNTPAGTAQTLDELKALGVQRIRVSVYWATVAPDSTSATRPQFNAPDPAAYPTGAWDRYDQVIEMAAQRGIGVNLDVTSPAPLWATSGAPKSDVANLSNPAPAEFAAFVHALGVRYSGSYVPPVAPAPTPPSSPSAPPPPCGVVDQALNNCPPAPPPSPSNPSAPPTPASPPLPRVSSWSIWNEPNEPGWLDPQWVPEPAHRNVYVANSPRLYRGLLDSAYGQLVATGHGADTILVGETAPKGLNVRGPTRAIKPLDFIRVLYCVNASYRPLRGASATAEGCPANAAGTSGFAAAHPALFRATGWAHHPYSLTTAPNVVPHDPADTTIADLPRLSTALARALAAYHQARRGGLPLYLTEFGYNTKPPNPSGVSPADQAAYLDQAEYLAYSDPQVRALSQFLLVDSPPEPGRNGVTAGYGATFQTGLEFLGGQAKPALGAYRLPIYLPQPQIGRGKPLRVWGRVRPADDGGSDRIAIQYRRAGSHGRFATLQVASADVGAGFLDTRVHVPASGQLRLAWQQPGAGVVYSRTAGATVGSTRRSARVTRRQRR